MNQPWILAVSLSVSFRCSNEICVSQSCQDLNQQWTLTPASEISISWRMRGRAQAEPLCIPQGQLCPAVPGRHWEMWKQRQSVRPGAVWITHTELCSAPSGAAPSWAGRKLCGRISRGRFSFSLVIVLPSSPQFAIHQRSASAPWGHRPCLCSYASQ